MSYEICVVDSALAATKEAACVAWNDQTYWDSSAPAMDRTARKWKIKDALLAFNPALTFNEPKAPGQGFLTKFFNQKKPESRCITVRLMTGELDTTFDIFDQAIEINLSWDAQRDQVHSVVSDVWRHLEQLSQMGLATLYDTERDALLNLNADFEIVMQGYIKNLEPDGEKKTNKKGSAPSAVRTAAVATPPDANQPFSGNVADSKPWWKS